MVDGTGATLSDDWKWTAVKLLMWMSLSLPSQGAVALLWNPTHTIALVRFATSALSFPSPDIYTAPPKYQPNTLVAEWWVWRCHPKAPGTAHHKSVYKHRGYKGREVPRPLLPATTESGQWLNCTWMSYNAIRRRTRSGQNLNFIIFTIYFLSLPDAAEDFY